MSDTRNILPSPAILRLPQEEPTWAPVDPAVPCSICQVRSFPGLIPPYPVTRGQRVLGTWTLRVAEALCTPDLLTGVTGMFLSELGRGVVTGCLAWGAGISERICM